MQQTVVELGQEQLLKLSKLGGVHRLVSQNVAVLVNNAGHLAIQLSVDPQATPAVAVLHFVPAAHAHCVGQSCTRTDMNYAIHILRIAYR